MKKITGIYIITNPNNKIYIGQSRDINKRWYRYKRLECKSQIKLYNSFLKYGVNNHKFEIICLCKENNLNNLEEFFIHYYKSFNSLMGLNLNSGGNSKLHSEETKLKISASNKISLNTPEHKLRAGNINRNKKMPDHVKKLISEKVKQITYPHKFKKIKQYDKDNNFIKNWDSIKEASKALNIHANAISNCLKELTYSSGGYKWKYFI